MIDLEGTKSMICLDNLSPHDIAYLITLDSSRENALLSASEKVPAKVS
ncbi:hypothetical protein L8106_15005 [Lyngbya sp. PCC 8106]|nr:hypothetical protein L8106_15005 [Lyngbya sp. PCC 8106]